MENVPKTYTAKELNDRNGKAGNPVYIAWNGKVYDVSSSRMWTEGIHQGIHSAGLDLTKALTSAPHDEKVFSRFPIVGELETQGLKHNLTENLERLHIHGMAVHFSLTFAFITVLFALLYLLTGEISYETTAYYTLFLALIVTPFSGLSGAFSWKVTYEGRRTRTFNRKIALSVVSLFIIVVCFVWRALVPELLVEKTIASLGYIVLLSSFTVVNAMLGHYGGRIVYP